MPMTYAKLFSSLVHSTLWREPNHVRVVWVTMLAMADKEGCVLASIPGLADVSRVSIDECGEALEKFLSPDEFSRSKEHDGRRIVEITGGWKLLNYEKYRNEIEAEHKKELSNQRVKRFRAKQALMKAPKPEEDLIKKYHVLNDYGEEVEVEDGEAAESEAGEAEAPDPFAGMPPAGAELLRFIMSQWNGWGEIIALEWYGHNRDAVKGLAEKGISPIEGVRDARCGWEPARNVNDTTRGLYSYLSKWFRNELKKVREA